MIFLRLPLLAIFVAFAIAAVAPVSAAPQRPNIIFIVADDLGFGETGCYGGKDIPTPNIDSLAASGVRFTNAYVTAPFCAASRAALHTGRYQTRFGFEFNPIGPLNSDPRIGLPVQEKTIADRLRDSGYATALIGKWHLGGTAKFHPQRRGFDEFFGFLHEGHYYVPPPWDGVTTWLRRKSLPDGGKGRWVSPNGRIIWSTHMGHHEHEYDTDNPILRSSQPERIAENLTDAFTTEACSFITRHQSQPFLLHLAYSAVHSPMQASDHYMTQFAHIPDVHRRIFAAMLAHMDTAIGQILAAVRSTGIEDRTLIFFISDNGGPTKELTSQNGPLRGGKGDLWEGGIHVPMIASWKGHWPAGQTIDRPVLSIDASATALEAAGIQVPPVKLDGINLEPIIMRQSPDAIVRDTLYWRVGKKQALRSGHWKLIRTEGTDAKWQLYDLAQDLGESQDLADAQPDKVQELAKLWDQWNAQQAEALW